MSNKFWNEERYEINGRVYEFRLNTPHPEDSDDDAEAKAAKLALGELIPLITVVPANPSGEVNKLWYPDVVDQNIREGLEATQLDLYSPITGNPKIQLYDLRDSKRRQYGKRGWVHFSALDFNYPVAKIAYPKVVGEGRNAKVVNDVAFVSLPREWDASHGIFRVSKNIPSEWLRLQRDTENSWRALADDTIDQRTGVGNGTLLAGYRLQLHTGVTFRIAPVVWSFEAKSGEKKGEEILMSKRQETAKAFYATVQAIAAGEISVEDAARQYFQDKLFDGIAYQQAKGVEIDEATHEKLVETLNQPADEAPAKTGVMVTFEGRKVDINELAPGNYIFKKDDGTVEFHNNRTFSGKKNMAAVVNRLDGRVVLEKATWS